MSMQVSLQLSEKMLVATRQYAEQHGFDSIQELIREVLRERLFEPGAQKQSGVYTSIASERALAKTWLVKEEDQAWAHLQKDK